MQQQQIACNNYLTQRVRNRYIDLRTKYPDVYGTFLSWVTDLTNWCETEGITGHDPHALTETITDLYNEWCDRIARGWKTPPKKAKLDRDAIKYKTRYIMTESNGLRGVYLYGVTGLVRAQGQLPQGILIDSAEIYRNENNQIKIRYKVMRR